MRSGGERLLTMKRIAQMKERLDWSKEPCNAMAKWFAEARKLAFDQVRLSKCRIFFPKNRILKLEPFSKGGTIFTKH